MPQRLNLCAAFSGTVLFLFAGRSRACNSVRPQTISGPGDGTTAQMPQGGAILSLRLKNVMRCVSACLNGYNLCLIPHLPVAGRAGWMVSALAEDADDPSKGL